MAAGAGMTAEGTITIAITAGMGVVTATAATVRGRHVPQRPSRARAYAYEPAFAGTLNRR
jgi:hypothetical protein